MKLTGVDVPWINTQCHPSKTAQIFHIDIDILKQQMPVFYLAAIARYRADSYTSLTQLTTHLSTPALSAQLTSPTFTQRWDALAIAHSQHLAAIAAASQPLEDDTFGAAHLCTALRRLVPPDTIFAIEAVTNTFPVADAIRATLPGSWLNCGGGGLGWSGGGALGIKLATDHAHGGSGAGKFVVQIVGDGSFLFSVPGSVYWIAQRYNIPILTIVLNNNGWNAPRKSLLLVHPQGLGSQASNEEINISFEPVPDYAGIAKAAAGGRVWAEKVERAGELEDVLRRAVEEVMGGRTAVVDAVVVSGR
jgi:thiamine pyrophosphate-dependent acetolactate synthase large subunit-like protein